MKRIASTLVLAGAVLAATAIVPVPTTPSPIKVAWNYPGAVVPDSFNIYWSTNLASPLASWTLLTNVPCPIIGTNVDAATGFPNYTRQLSTNATILVQPGQAFFFCTSSNLWGESIPSNAAGTPPIPSGVNSLGVAR